MPKLKEREVPRQVIGLNLRLRYARELLGLGVNELGKLSGTSGPQITRAEKDSEIPGIIIICALAEALGVRTAWLLLGEEPMRDEPLRFPQRAPKSTRTIRKRSP